MAPPLKYQPVTKTCLICNKELFCKGRYQILHQKVHAECKGEFLHRLSGRVRPPDFVDRPCQICRKLFKVDTHKTGARLYCDACRAAPWEGQCKQCGKTFRAERPTQFHSPECRKAALEGKHCGGGAPKTLVPCDKICPVCGDTFHCETWYQITQQETCSRQCRTEVHGNGRSVETTKRKCKGCDVVMNVLPCHLNTKWYHDKECQSASETWRENQRGSKNGSWEGGNGTYWKRQCLEASKGVCSRCGKTAEGHDLHAHHLIPVKFGGTNEQSNLVALCSSCHPKVEQVFRLHIQTELKKHLTPEILQAVEKFQRDLIAAGPPAADPVEPARLPTEEESTS